MYCYYGAKSETSSPKGCITNVGEAEEMEKATKSETSSPKEMDCGCGCGCGENEEHKEMGCGCGCGCGCGFLRWAASAACRAPPGSFLPHLSGRGRH